MSTETGQLQFVGFWGSMILNYDIDGLIHHQGDTNLLVEWLLGRPVVWPGTFG